MKTNKQTVEVESENHIVHSILNIGVILIVCVIISTIAWQFPIWLTEGKLKNVAKQSEWNNPIQVEDWWGNIIKIEEFPFKDGVAHVATSAGRDQIFGSEDDLTYRSVNWNVSGIAGKFIGSRSKEFIKGLGKGLLGKE